MNMIGDICSFVHNMEINWLQMININKSFTVTSKNSCLLFVNVMHPTSCVKYEASYNVIGRLTQHKQLSIQSQDSMWSWAKQHQIITQSDYYPMFMGCITAADYCLLFLNISVEIIMITLNQKLINHFGMKDDLHIHQLCFQFKRITKHYHPVSNLYSTAATPQTRNMRFIIYTVFSS